jgi:hypothetical protein
MMRLRASLVALCPAATDRVQNSRKSPDGCAAIAVSGSVLLHSARRKVIRASLGFSLFAAKCALVQQVILNRFEDPRLRPDPAAGVLAQAN